MCFRIVPEVRRAVCPVTTTIHIHPLQHLPVYHNTWPLLANPISALNSKAKNSPSNLITLVVTMFVGGIYVAWSLQSHQPRNRRLQASWERLLKDEIWHLDDTLFDTLGWSKVNRLLLKPSSDRIFKTFNYTSKEFIVFFPSCFLQLKKTPASAFLTF